MTVPDDARLALARAETALAAARAQSSAERLLDATRALGALRVVATERADTVLWQRGLLDEAQALSRQLKAENEWVRSQFDEKNQLIAERTAQVEALTAEVAWLRGVVEAGEAALEAARHASAMVEQRLAAAEARASPLRTLAVRSARAILRRRKTTPPRPLPPIVPVPVPAPAEPEPLVPEQSGAPAAPVLLPQPHLPTPNTAPHGPVGTVHQFHPDVAEADAITNAMFMLRSVLRAMGYVSDIFVERRPDSLAHETRLVDSLPRHNGYVLLTHHSMGYAGFEHIQAMAARKVLIYHNITPPEFLGHAPGLQRNAALGRKQLAAWRGHVEAALALSEYNAIELRRLGFDAVRSSALLFDLDALRQRATAAAAPRDGSVFTILFVGRVTASKGQDGLIAAYAAFSIRFAQPSRLVLVGGFDAEEFGYLDHLTAIILEHGLSDQVLLTGKVSDAELDSWFARADLYVSLSQHEGFGVPLIEAMAHGVPVLAWPAGAIPYTLGGTAAVLTSRAPDAVAGQILALAEDPAHRTAIIARQTASLHRFDLSRQIPPLQEALALAGAQPPPAAAIRDVLAANAQLTIAGHVNKSYSLSAVNRTIAATFERLRPGTVRLIPVEGDPTKFIGEVPAEAFAFVKELVARPEPTTGPHIVLSQHYPVYVPQQRGDVTLAMVFWEESRFPAETVAVLNGGFDGVLAPSRFVARLLVDSGVARPVINIGQAPPLDAFAAIPARPARSPFTFLHVSSTFPRKGFDVLLNAWQRAFRATDAVSLVVKTAPNPHSTVADQIDRLRQTDPEAAPILLIDRDLDEASMIALYVAADAMVLPTRGEGYNLPAAEAMASGLPVIVTDATGHRDFCGPDTARLVRSRPAPAATHVTTPHSVWREPDAADLASALREAANGVPPTQITAARAAIAASADPARFTERLSAIAATLLLEGPPPPIRLAWVTTWDVRCGIANYARALIDAMPQDGIARLAILCDDRTPGDGDAVRPCWSLDPAQPLDALIATVQNEDADVVMIQHQPGLLRWTALTTLLTALVADRRAVIVTLHNTAHLLEIEPAERNAAIAVLGQAARVLVHTIADLSRLEALGLDPVLMPQSVPPPTPPRPARMLPAGADPMIGCYGFFLPGKGIGTLIAAVASLRAQWPRIRLRLVNAIYDEAHSAEEIAACRALAQASGLAAEWHTGYLPEAESTALLAGCDLIALPYAPSRESSSAAVRSALASGVPVAVSPIALFDELGDAVARFADADPAAVAGGIATLLADPVRRAQLSETAALWAADRAAADIARRLLGLQRGLAAQRRLGVPLDGALWSP
jgi:glycosyltransferase involved in cell wall biosynthesis